MEIEYKDFIIGYSDYIDFSNMEDHNFNKACTLQLMKTPDGSSYVIIYTWINHEAKLFNDNLEAFYIDNINKDNEEEAKRIFLEVYRDLLKAYEENPHQLFDMKTYVENKFSFIKKPKNK